MADTKKVVKKEEKKTTPKKKTAAVKKATTTVKKKLEKKVQIKKEFPYRENDCWIFVALLAMMAILATSFNDYTFNVDNISLSISIFIAPFLYFIANFITKKYGIYKSITAIIVSGLAMFLFIISVDVIANIELNYMTIMGQYLGYMASQAINLIIYYYLLENACESGLFTYFTFIFAVLINNLIFMIFAFNSVVTDTFWLEYFGSLMFECIVFIPLAFTDAFVERGL